MYHETLGTMRGGRIPVAWSESDSPPDAPNVCRIAFIDATGIVTIGGRSQAPVCPTRSSSGLALSRIDENHTAVLWIEPTLPFDAIARVACVTDDLTVGTEASLSVAADCTPEGLRFAWRGDRLTGRTLDVRRVDANGAWQSAGTYTLDARASSLEFLAPAAGDGDVCMELAESGAPIEGSRVCSSCTAGANGAPWRVTREQGDGAWRLRFRASSDVVLNLRVLDVAGRSVAAANERVVRGGEFSWSSESLRLPVGWYRVRATDGTHVTDTPLIVVR